MRIPNESKLEDCNDTQKFEEVTKFENGEKTSTMMTETFALYIKMKTF